MVSVEEEDGELHFDELIEQSGNSTVQIIFFNESDIDSTVAPGGSLFGCFPTIFMQLKEFCIFFLSFEMERLIF